jgi:xylulokinase
MVFIGLDIGTTGSKAIATDHKGHVKAQAYGKYKAIRLSSGHAEIDPSAVWQTVKIIITCVAKEAGEPVAAIAVASFGESFILMDKNDNILHNSLLYTDFRGVQETNDILRLFSEQQLYNITGMPANSMFSLNKLLWMKKNRPEILEQTDKLFMFEDFIYYMLSGERYIDHSLASRTMLFDFQKCEWSSNVLEAFEINSKLFSKPVRTGSIIGVLSSKVAEELGLNKGIKLVAGAHDQICAALGAGVLGKGESVDGIGTSECITVCLQDLSKTEFMRKHNYCIEPYAIKDEYVTLAFNATGGSIMSWFCENISRPELNTQSDAMNYFDVIENQCPVEPTDLLVLPHFAGSGTPHMDPYSTGAILGLRLSTQSTEIYKACVEGICFEMLYNVKLLEQMGTSINSMTCVGGGSKSPFVLQVKADIMGIPVRKLKEKESGTIGLAMICAAACGEFKNLREAAEQSIKIDKIFYPNERRYEKYQQKYKDYEKLYSAISSIRMK